MLSTLLLVVTFLMSIFMLSQYFASQEASGKDTALQPADAADHRAHQPAVAREGQEQIDRGRARRAAGDAGDAAGRRTPSCRARHCRATSGEGRRRAHRRLSTAELESQKKVSDEALAKVDLLNQQLLALRRQIAALNEALQASEKKDTESQARIKDLGARLNAALARQVQELQRYRSDFFGRLRELLKDRKDIRVVGDRFVFESEVLFPSGSGDADAGGLGRHGSARRRHRRA